MDDLIRLVIAVVSFSLAAVGHRRYRRSTAEESFVGTAHSRFGLLPPLVFVAVGLFAVLTIVIR